MKRIILLIILFFTAVAISPMLVKEKGYILIAMNDLTIESTVVNAVIMLTLSFIALLMLLKLFKGSIKLGFSGWNKFAFASQRRGLANFQKGIAAYILGNYQQAEHLLAKSAEPTQLQNSAYLLAAAAGEKQALPENTKHYLALLNNLPSNKQLGLEPALVQIQLLFTHNDLANARLILDQHHKEIGHDYRLLTLEINVCLQEQRYQTAIDYLALARKEKNINEPQIIQWEEVAFYQQFNSLITNKNSKELQQYWLNLPKKLRQQNSIIYAYCRVLSQRNISDSLTDILLPALKKGSNTAFLLKMRSLPVHGANQLITLVQHHLHKDPQNSLWLSYLAHLASGDNQLQMADKAFNSLLHLPDAKFGEHYDSEDLRTFAKVLTKLGKHEKSNQILTKLVDCTM